MKTKDFEVEQYRCVSLPIQMCFSEDFVVRNKGAETMEQKFLDLGLGY
jgi:hypothetical protein